ncbi:MAG TPA: acyl-CoA dehydrogenase family protein, partial [Burkholderiaceae bacterium]
CWYGAAERIAAYVRDAVAHAPDPHRQAHLGAIDVALNGAACLLRTAAAEIDSAPSDTCFLAVSRARLAVEAAAEEVLRRAPRALGPGPLCRDASLARLMADLPIFIRQSHAERDQAAHGRHMVEAGGDHPWKL